MASVQAQFFDLEQESGQFVIFNHGQDHDHEEDHDKDTHLQNSENKRANARPKNRQAEGSVKPPRRKRRPLAGW